MLGVSSSEQELNSNSTAVIKYSVLFMIVDLGDSAPFGRCDWGDSAHFVRCDLGAYNS